jgi:hypothetical protein
LGSYENKNAPLWNQGVARPTSVGRGAPCAKSLAKVAKNAKLSFGLCGLCEKIFILVGERHPVIDDLFFQVQSIQAGCRAGGRFFGLNNR